MAAIEQRKPSFSRKSMAWQALFVIVMVLLMRFLWVRTQPERLWTGPGSNVIISGENVYLWAYHETGEAMHPVSGRKSELVLEAKSIYDGSTQRIIGKEDAALQFTGGEENFSLRGAKLYYAVEPRPKSMSAGFTGNSGGSTADRYLGTFLWPRNSSPGTDAQQKRVDVWPNYLGVRDIRFRQISLQGGTPRDAATFRTARVCLLGDQVFWIRPGPEERTSIVRRQGDRDRQFWTEVTAHSDLMLTALTDGATRCIRHGIPCDTILHPGEAGVTWIEPAPFPERPTLFYARGSDGSVRSLGTPAKDNEFANRVTKQFVEFGNRIYWLAASPSSESNGSYHFVLTSANLDGRDIRNVCTQRDNHPIDVLSLHGYRGALYCCIIEAPLTSPGVGPRNQYLCRVHPERADPLEIVYRLPKGFGSDQFDGGYLYLVRNEQKRSLWATITDDPGGMLMVKTHCRISLDR